MIVDNTDDASVFPQSGKPRTRAAFRLPPAIAKPLDPHHFAEPRCCVQADRQLRWHRRDQADRQARRSGPPPEQP